MALCALLSVVVPEVAAQQTGTCTSPLSEEYLDINNVRARVFNNGNLFWRGSPSVYEVPDGGGVSAIFNSGIWVGGLVGDELRVAAARYGNYQFWAGPLDDEGAPPDDCSVYDRMYKVSRGDIIEYDAMGSAEPDLRDWPTGLGAPTLAPPNNGLDDDDDGVVDEEEGELVIVIGQPLASRVGRVIDLAGGERPAILGDQSIWWIMNDRGNEHLLPGGDTPPVGLEVHAMAFAFNAAGPMGDATFYKYDLFYKGSDALREAYMAVYSDPDLGHYQDDWIGSDTIRGIGFVWNADNDDEGGSGYGTPPPALGYDFVQGPIVPSPGDTATVSGVRVPDFRNLGMSVFGYYSSSLGPTSEPNNAVEYYNYMQGRWADGQRFTYGGDGRSYSQDSVDHVFPGDVGNSLETCQFWSECNVDGLGLVNIKSDRVFFISSGPFTINQGDYQQIVFGIIWARGENNHNSVTAMKQADELAQAAFDVNFEVPGPPDPPMLVATPADEAVILEWSYSPLSNNYLNSYSAEDPFTPDDDKDYLFEGYDVIQYENVLDDVGRVIATFDVPNGVMRVIDGFPGEPSEVTATGSDNGVVNSYTVSGLTNYKTYHFAVQAYAYNAPSFPKVYRGPVARVSVVPTIPTRDVSDAAQALMGGSAPDFVAEAIVSVGDGEVYARVVNPVRMLNATYTVDFYEHDFGKNNAAVIAAAEDGVVDPMGPDALTKVQDVAEVAITYNISRNDEPLFVGSDIPFAAPLGQGVFSADGLTFDVLGPSAGFKDFHVTANADGVLDPSDYAAWGWAGMPDPRGYVVGFRGYQQVSGAVWGYHAGGGAEQNNTYPSYGPASNGNSFLGRTMRGGALYPFLGVWDYEQRFSEDCVDGMDGTIDVDNDCLAFREYSDDAIMEMPFTLWRVGVDTPDDPSDDIQMVPIICDSNTCGGGNEHDAYDIGGDHGASSGNNDPLTDWIYWNLPSDASPGSAGYKDFFTQLDGGTVSAYTQVIARTVLVAWNEGTAPPYDRPLPESGTVFLIQTNKSNQPGDKYAFSTDGYGAVQPEGDRALERLDEIGIVPNPYKGASDYEVSQLTNEVRFTNMPDVATIRVFTLNGTLVKTIEKRSPGIATISWDMVTDFNLPIASGLYLIHVTVPDVGEKVLKFGVIKKRVQLNTY